MNASIMERDLDRNMWLTLLGVFTFWLIVQNAAIMTIVSVMHPELAVGIVVDAVRALAHVIATGGRFIAALATETPGWLMPGVLNTLTGGLL